MDIIRIKTNNNFRYYNKKTKKVVDNKTKKRIKSLRIPPAYTNVHVHSDPDNKHQAIGFDSLNRKQYIYHPQFKEESQEIKFEDLIYFGKKIKRIRKDINSLLECNDNIPKKENVIGLVIFLIDRCNFRVGSDKYKKLYNSYGVTTLNKKHINFKNNCIKIEFTGKKGVLNTSKVSNKNSLKMINKLCNIYGNNEFLFCYQDKDGNVYRVTEKHINDFLKKYHRFLSVKMFRTWAANQILLKELLSLPVPQTPTESKRNVLHSIKKAAKLMHHTSNVSKKSYMNNDIIDMYLKDFDNFYGLMLKFKKSNNQLPTIDRLLNLYLTELFNKRQND